MREFRASAVFLVTLYSLLTLLTLGGLGVFMLGVTSTPRRPAVWLLPGGLALLAWAWSVYLHLPFLIVYREDQTFECRSLFRLHILSPGDIRSVRRMPVLPWFLQVRHAAGKLVLTTLMTDISDLIALIRRENPAAEVSWD